MNEIICLAVITVLLLAAGALSLLWSALRIHASTAPDYRKLGQAVIRHEHDRAIARLEDNCAKIASDMAKRREQVRGK